MITDPLFYFFAVPAILIFGIAKGGFGNAIGVVAVPLMALAVSPLQAAAILLPILCVMDVFAIRKFWRQWDVTNIVIMLPAGCVGVLVGSLTFSYLNEGHVRLLIGLLALIFAKRSQIISRVASGLLLAALLVSVFTLEDLQ